LGVEKHEIKQLRTGIYQRYLGRNIFGGGNPDEGWTRWLLEHFEFPYTTLKDKDIKKGGLREHLDLIILPNDPTLFITGEKAEEWCRTHWPFRVFSTYPPEYRSGLDDEEGIKRIKEFAEKGGTLVAFNESCNFCIEKLGLKVKNVLSLEPKEFYCPGSTLRAKVNNSHPLAYGMPKDALILFWDSPAFEILPSEYNERYEVVVKYPERDILQSGWLIGEEKIAEKIAMLSVKYGEGRVVLIGFRTQHRGQTHGTFKLLFNALIG